MTIYQNSIANLGAKLEITHASPDIANNRTTITYKASVYKVGSHNPWNLSSETPMSLTINGQSLYSTSAGNYDLRAGTYEQTIKSGTLVIPHNSDGSKSFSFSWNVNFTSTGYGYGNVTTSDTYVLPNIGRKSTFTIPSTTITTGDSFVVSISRASSSFSHKVSYIVGGNETTWISNAATSYTATVPHSLFHSYKSTDSVSGVIRVTTMNGSSVVGSSQKSVTINLSTAAIPTLASVSYTNSNKGMFTGENQFIRGISRATARAGTASGSYSSTISSYEYRIMRGSTAMSSVTQTASSYQFPAFSFPNSGSEAGVYLQMRVRDSRGRYSSWVNSSQLRVHYYAPPAIGTMTVRRVGGANTTLQVNRNYNVTSMNEGGGATNSNNAVLRFQHRVKGSSTTTNNTGAGSTTMSLSNSNANLAGTFATGTSYEVRAVLSDKLNTIYGSWVSVGTEFVPMDIAPKGVGIGKIHSNGSADLEVGSGGINSEGNFTLNGTFRPNGAIEPKLLSSNINLNSYTTPGYYYCPANATVGTWTNAPSGNACTLIVIRHAGVTQYFQEYATSAGSSRLFYRNQYGSSWSAWKKILTENTMGSGSGLDADLLDGKHASSFWSSSNDGSGSGLDADLLDGKHASQFAGFKYTKSGIFEIYEIGEMMIITGQKGTDTTVSDWTRDGSVTYPKAFAEFPRLSLTVTTFSTRDKATPYLYSSAKTGFGFTVWDNPVNGVRTVHFIAIGKV